MCEFLVGGGCGNQQAILVAGCETANNAGAGYGALGYRNKVGKFGFEDAVEGLGGAESEETVGVCEG